MGKNSTMGKNYRLLNELSHHMNYKVSANSQELRQTYIPVMRERILKLLKNADDASVKEAIALMDEYGLNREDIAEKIETFAIGKGYDSFEDLDSKQKAAFTREYNAGSHMSQALVQEQGGGSKRKRKGSREKDPNDLDAIDDDDVDEDDDDDENSEDEEKELKKLQEQFKKKGRRAAASKKAKASKSKKK